MNTINKIQFVRKDYNAPRNYDFLKEENIEFTTSSITLKSELNLVPIKLIIRVPNPLGISDVRECPFYDEFCEYINVNDMDTTIMKLRYLRDKIDDYVRSYELYCDWSHTMPMMYIIM